MLNNNSFSKLCLVIIVLLLLCSLINYQPNISATLKTTFSDGSPDAEITFPIGGGINDTITISILNDTSIKTATLNITTKPINGQYPSNVFLDVGADGDYEWAFNGPGFGAMGNQTLFNSTKSRLTKRFSGTVGEKLSNQILIPKNAQINSAVLSITGQFTEFSDSNNVNSNLGQSYGLKLGDIDNDGDLDTILSYREQASPFATKVIWLENTAGDGSAWTKHDIVSSGLSWPYGLAVGDIDNDNDLDVAVSDNAWNTKQVYWYNNTNGDGSSWTTHSIHTPITTATSTYIYEMTIADMNNDTKNDVVVSLFNTDDTQEDIFWYENVYGNGSNWSKNIIRKSISSTRSLYVGDIDNDGDNDTAITVDSSGTDLVYWLSNDDGNGTTWSVYQIDNTLTAPFSCAIGDLNRDGLPDLLSLGQAGTVWYEAPADPTNTSAWVRRTIGVGAGSGTWANGDLDLVDIGYNITGQQPDGYPDVCIVGRNNNDVIIFKNDGTPGNGGWRAIYLNSNHANPANVAVGDIDGDGYNDTIAASNLWSTTDDLKWYKLNGGYPTDLELDFGFDSAADWVNPGKLDNTIQIPDFALNLTQYKMQGIGFEDDYGNRLMPIPLEITSTKPGYVVVDKLNIEYEYTAVVSQGPTGSLASEITDASKLTTPDETGNCSIVFRFISSTSGKLKLDGLKIEYNEHPWFEQNLPSKVLMPEDTKNYYLLDLSPYLNDDYLLPTELGYNITSVTGPGIKKLKLGIFDGHYLGADAETGKGNDNWTGYLDFKIKVTDELGSSIESDQIRLEITPVNDEPILGMDEYPDLVMSEGSETTPLDLDDRNYFTDGDLDKLYFSIEIDPDNNIKGENFTYDHNYNTNQVTFKSNGDWSGTDVPVLIYCDDSLPVNVTLKKQFMITVLNQNDPPTWTDIPDIELDEDSIANDHLNLKNYVADIDDSFENLTLSVISNSNYDSISVSIDKSGNLDIKPLKPEFVGSAMITVRAQDPGNNYSDESFKVTYNKIDDPPAIELVSPKDNSVIASDSVILTWKSMDIDTPEQNLTYTVYLSDSSPPELAQAGIIGNRIIIEDLVDSAIYYCQLEASDGTSSSVTEIISFLTDLSVQPVVDLISPRSEAILKSTDVEFSWKVLENKNNLDLIYDLYVDTDPNPLLSGLQASGLTSTSHTITGLKTNVTYYWTVIPSFEAGLGISQDGVNKFSIDPSKVVTGLEIVTSITELEIEYGEQETFEVDVKNIGTSQEEIKVMITPSDFDKNIQRDIRTPSITLVSGGVKTIRLTLNTNNFLPGEYTIIITANAIDTDAEAQTEINLKIIEEETESESDELLSDYILWIPIIIMIIITILIAIVILRYKPKEEETFEDALSKKLKEDVSLPRSELMMTPPGQKLDMGLQSSSTGQPQLPTSGSGMGVGTQSSTSTGAMPQLPPVDQTAYDAGSETATVTSSSELPSEKEPELDISSLPEDAFESGTQVPEGPQVMLPEETDEADVKKPHLEAEPNEEPIPASVPDYEEPSEVLPGPEESSGSPEQHPTPKDLEMPEIELPESEPASGPEMKAEEKIRSDSNTRSLSTAATPELGDPLKLETIPEEREPQKTDKDGSTIIDREGDNSKENSRYSKSRKKTEKN